MLNTTNKKNTNAPSAANLSEAENNIMPAAVGKTITPSQNANTYSTGASNNGLQPVKLAQPTNHSPLINDLYEAQKKASLDALDSQYTAAIGELERQKAAIPVSFNEARRQTAGTNAQERRGMNEVFTAQGLSSGAQAQGNIAQSNALQRDLSALQLAEAQALADLEIQRTQTGEQYRALVREAIMNNEMQKAAALYDEAVRYDEDVMRRALEQAQLDAEIASMRKASTGSGSYTAPKEPTLSITDAKLLAQSGLFSDAVLDAFYRAGWDDAAITSVYGYVPSPQPAGTPDVPSWTLLSHTPFNPVSSQHPQLRSPAAKSLYAQVSSNRVPQEAAAQLLAIGISRQEIDDDEADAILSAMGF